MLKQDTLLYLLNKLTNDKAVAFTDYYKVTVYNPAWYSSKIKEVLAELGLKAEDESNNKVPR